ncbi:3554_t:CDS:2, partial [Gigaspora rosea]
QSKGDKNKHGYGPEGTIEVLEEIMAIMSSVIKKAKEAPYELVTKKTKKTYIETDICYNTQQKTATKSGRGPNNVGNADQSTDSRHEKSTRNSKDTSTKGLKQ